MSVDELEYNELAVSKRRISLCEFCNKSISLLSSKLIDAYFFKIKIFRKFFQTFLINFRNYRKTPLFVPAFNLKFFLRFKVKGGYY